MTRMRKTRLQILAISLNITMVAPGVRAQALNAIEFNFLNPGARSLGFGGAFAAVADDATAAFANPAGLVQLLRPEISVEETLGSYSTLFTEGCALGEV